MGSYVRKTLMHDEHVVYEGRISIWFLIPQILLGLVLLVVIIGLFFLIKAYIRYISTELVVTNKRIISKFGFIQRHTVEINLRKVESVRVEQGFWGRIFNYGTLIIAGGGYAQAPIPGISNPVVFRNTLNDTVHNL